jgi:rubrerythrin
MNMIVRSKRGNIAARHRTRGATGRNVEHPTAVSESPGARRTGIVSERPAARSSEKRHGGPSEDRAVYSCQCGYVFEEQVSTTVGCPHCGHTQAW